MKKRFTFYWESETIEKLREKAKKENRSLNNYIETLLEKDVKEKK